MAKLLTLVVAAVLLLAATVANATSYTVTTTVEEGGMMINQGRECGREMQQHRQQLRHCEQVLSEQTMGGGGQQYFARAIMNQMPEQIQHFYQCCQALQNIRDQQCVCESLERMASSGREQSAQSAMTRASVLPLFCGLGHTCQFGSSSYGDV